MELWESLSWITSPQTSSTYSTFWKVWCTPNRTDRLRVSSSVTMTQPSGKIRTYTEQLRIQFMTLVIEFVVSFKNPNWFSIILIFRSFLRLKNGKKGSVEEAEDASPTLPHTSWKGFQASNAKARGKKRQNKSYHTCRGKRRETTSTITSISIKVITAKVHSLQHQSSHWF